VGWNLLDWTEGDLMVILVIWLMENMYEYVLTNQMFMDFPSIFQLFGMNILVPRNSMMSFCSLLQMRIWFLYALRTWDNCQKIYPNPPWKWLKMQVFALQELGLDPNWPIHGAGTYLFTRKKQAIIIISLRNFLHCLHFPSKGAPKKLRVKWSTTVAQIMVESLIVLVITPCQMDFISPYPPLLVESPINFQFIQGCSNKL
jgi:hypothetical protein